MSALIKLISSKLQERKAASGANSTARRPSIPAVAPEMSFDGGVLRMGRRSAAVAMNWVPTREGASVKAQAAAAVNPEPLVAGDRSARGNYNSYVALEGTGFLGLGSSSLGHKRGMVSLVTALPQALAGERWIGAFPMDKRGDLWWLGSMRNGQVFEDRIISGKSRAEDALRENLGAPDWTAIFAPEEWHVRGAEDKKIWELADLGAAGKLRDLNPVRTILPYAIAGTVAVAIGGASLAWMESKKAEELARLEELRRQAEARITVGPADYPYHEMVRLAEFVPACEKAITDVILLVPGWEMQPAACTIAAGGKGQVTAGWTRSGGRLSWLISASPRDWPDFEVDETGDEVSISLPFEAPIDPASSADQPWPSGVVQGRMRDRFQTLGIEMGLRASPDNQEVAVAVPVFNSHELMIGSVAGLGNYVDILSDVPALMPQTMIYNTGTGQWDMVVKIFHPVLLPEPRHEPEYFD